mgnify:CR=1 FL=1
MVLLAAFVLLISSICVLLMALFAIRRESSLFLSWGAIAFVSLDSLGLVILPFLNLNLPYLQDTYVVYEKLDGRIMSVYINHIFSHFVIHVFVALVLLALVVLNVKRSNFFMINKTSSVNFFGRLVLVLVGFFGSYFFFKYFIFGPGLKLLVAVRIFFSNPIEAVTARSLAWNLIKPGQGSFGVSVVSYNFLPFLAVLVALSNYKSKRFFVLCWMAFLVLSLLFALQTYQKAPLAFVVLIYTIILYLGIRFNKMRKNLYIMDEGKSNNKFVIIVFVLGVILGVGLYVVNFGLSFKNSILSLFGRIFLVPVNTESFWFLVYPEFHEFLGLKRAIHTNMDVIRTTAYLATGDIFSANASFVATGWSGLGFWGVAISGGLVIFYLALLDILMRNKPVSVRMISVYTTLPALFFLVSGTFADFVFKGGLVPLLVLLSVGTKKYKSCLRK